MLYVVFTYFRITRLAYEMAGRPIRIKKYEAEINYLPI